MALSFAATGDLLARYAGPQRGRVAMLAVLLFSTVSAVRRHWQPEAGTH